MSSLYAFGSEINPPSLEAVAKSFTFSKPFSLKNWTSVHRNHASSTLLSASKGALYLCYSCQMRVDGPDV